MRYLTLDEVLTLQKKIIEQSGGSFGVRDKKTLPQILYPHLFRYPHLVDRRHRVLFLDAIRRKTRFRPARICVG